MEHRRILADMLQDYMRVNDLSLRDLSEVLGVSHATIHRWVKCEADPDAASQRKLAQLFGLPETPMAKLVEGRMAKRELLIERVSERLRHVPEYDLDYVTRILDALLQSIGEAKNQNSG